MAARTVTSGATSVSRITLPAADSRPKPPCIAAEQSMVRPVVAEFELECELERDKHENEGARARVDGCREYQDSEFEWNSPAIRLLRLQFCNPALHALGCGCGSWLEVPGYLEAKSRELRRREDFVDSPSCIFWLSTWPLSMRGQSSLWPFELISSPPYGQARQAGRKTEATKQAGARFCAVLTPPPHRTRSPPPQAARPPVTPVWLSPMRIHPRLQHYAGPRSCTCGGPKRGETGSSDWDRGR